MVVPLGNTLKLYFNQYLKHLIGEHTSFLTFILQCHTCICIFFLIQNGENIEQFGRITVSVSITPRSIHKMQDTRRVRVMVFNATFNNISDISWRSVLLVEETRVPGENYRLVASHWQTLSHNVVSSTTRDERDSNSKIPEDFIRAPLYNQ
jgi:hypothetical protein